MITKSVLTFRKDLKLWAFAIFFHTTGAFFSFFKTYSESTTYTLLSTLSSAIAVLFLIYASVKYYRKVIPNMLVKKSVPTTVPMILLFAQSSSSVSSTQIISMILLILSIIAIYLLYKIYQADSSPTHLFLFITLIATAITVGASMYSNIDSVYGQILVHGANIVLNTTLFLTGFVIRIEEVIRQKSSVIERNNLLLKKQIELSSELASHLSSSAEELSSSSEEISSSSENIASTQQQISKGAGEQAMAITSIQKKFSSLTTGMKHIYEKASKINQISDSIRNIANQTNMLALNAAIEAARAGEAGRGFNVVADQVRKLADESNKAVANTEALVLEISDITKAQETSAMEIFKEVDAVASVAEETSASTEESAAAAEEQAASMETISTTAAELVRLAVKLTTYTNQITNPNDDKDENEITLIEPIMNAMSSDTPEKSRTQIEPKTNIIVPLNNV